MEQDNIALLLERYWKAETTIEEERMISKYFIDKNIYGIPDTEADFFRAKDEFKAIPHQKTQFLRYGKPLSVKSKYQIILKIAAILLTGILLTYFGVNYNRQIKAKEELAMRQKIEADLVSMSQALNEAYSQLNSSTKSMIKLNPTKNQTLKNQL